MSKFAYTFSNLCGAVYSQGNIIFTNDGNSVLSPVGNRVSQFDLKNNKSCTFPFENRQNIYRFAVSPDGLLMISVDEEGRGLLVNMYRKVVLHSINFKKPVYDIKFSPNGKYFAVTSGRSVKVWNSPGHSKTFNPFSLYHEYPGQYDDTLCIDWSDDSNFFSVGSRDSSCRVFSLHRIGGFHYVTLAAHRSAVMACFFALQSLNVYTVSKDGALVVWEASISLDQMQEHIQSAEQRRRRRREGEEPRGEVAQNRGAGEKGLDVDESSEEEGEDQSIIAMEMDAVVTKESSDDSEEEEASEELRASNVCIWTKKDKHIFPQEYSRITCATMHKPSHLLVVGFSSGIFALYEVPAFVPIHTLSISQQRVTSVAINPTGDWLAFGCSSLGQLLVWEWHSESYVLKQQGHHYAMNVLTFGPDGTVIATGGDDCKVKLWNTSTGFCYVTFNEHTAAVSGLVFSNNGKVVFSSSHDGTVRAYDMHKYRNFRTFVSPRPVQFSCVALDPSGEVVCAGSHDTYEVFVWSVQTGRLLELLTGHEGPVSCVAFSPSKALLVSGSWDNTVRLWDVFEHKGAPETLTHSSNVLTLAFRPDGVELAVATLDGQILFWDVNRVLQTGSIEGKHDLQLGRRVGDKVTAQRLAEAAAHFTSLCYTADGRAILAGGRSKFVCIYNVEHQILLKKFQITRNRSLDGIERILNSSRMTEAGPLELLSEDEDISDREDIRLPGVRKGDMSARQKRLEICVKCVQFSPTGRMWATVCTEGLLVYSLDAGVTFDPFDLSMEVTRDNVLSTLREKHYSAALGMSFRLNEKDLIVSVMESIPTADVELIVQNLPLSLVERFLSVLAERVESSPHLQFYLHWCVSLLKYHTTHLRERSSSIAASIRDLQKSIVQKQTDLGRICDGNSYKLQYVLSLTKQREAIAIMEPQTASEARDNGSVSVT